MKLATDKSAGGRGGRTSSAASGSLSRGSRTDPNAGALVVVTGADDIVTADDAARTPSPVQSPPYSSFAFAEPCDGGAGGAGHCGGGGDDCVAEAFVNTAGDIMSGAVEVALNFQDVSERMIGRVENMQKETRVATREMMDMIMAEAKEFKDMGYDLMSSRKRRR